MDKNVKISELKKLLLDFRNKRDWKQFHNPKDLAEAISIESGELLELFLWQTKEEVKKKMESDPEFFQEVKDELADVINFCINFANAADLDIYTIVKEKLEKNDKKYPAEKSKGTATKYNKL